MTGSEYLREELSEYDGRSASILSEISMRHRGRARFLSDLVRLASDREPVISAGATWIMKVRLEQGQTLSRHDVGRLVRELEGVTAWQAQLHICQSVGHISVPEALVPDLESWLLQLLDAPRPFLRAWTVDAVCRLWGGSSKTDAVLAQMQSDQAASVRARVRNLKREFGAG